jgi:hypothetical protein
MAKLKIFPSDREWSNYIRERDDWTCQRCGKQYYPPTSALHCSHFWSRGNWCVRFDEENTEALCYGCHSYLGGNPMEFHRYYLEKIGQEKMDALELRKNTTKSGTRNYYLSKEFRSIVKIKMSHLKYSKCECSKDIKTCKDCIKFENIFRDILIFLKNNNYAKIQVSMKGVEVDGISGHFDFITNKMMTKKEIIDLAHNSGYEGK